MNRFLLRHALLPLGSLALATVAHAARPLATDDTGVLDRGDCEVEAVLGRDKADGIRTRGRSLQMGCGVGAGSQLALGVDRVESEGLRLRGTTLSGKLALQPGDAASWSASAGLLWVAAPGEARRHAATALNLLHTRSISERYTLHANLGHARDEGARSASTTWGLALEHGGWGPLAWMGELIGDDREAPAWNLGLRWTVDSVRGVLDLAYGQQLVSGRPSALSVGLKFAF